ncbi:MAG: hypothetical protein IKQ80_02690 [Clostridia bacterium]|nr:hypothetical protein [Clostridia bacterium]
MQKSWGNERLFSTIIAQRPENTEAAVCCQKGSPYTRIEGNGTEALQVIVKGGQPIWPEWLSDSAAGDLQGNRYELREGHWVQVDADAVGVAA